MRQATWMGVYCTGGNEAANTLYKYFQVTMLQKRKKKNTFSFPTLEHLRVYVLSYIVTDMAHKTFAGYSPWDYEKVAILWRRSYRSMSPLSCASLSCPCCKVHKAATFLPFNGLFIMGRGKFLSKLSRTESGPLISANFINYSLQGSQEISPIVPWWCPLSRDRGSVVSMVWSSVNEIDF